MDFNELSTSERQELTREWAALFDSSLVGITKLASKYRGNPHCQLASKHCGSFNFCARLHWNDDGPDWLVRFPIPGKSIFPEEKIHSEVATMRFIRANTTIPVPEVIAYGSAADNPTGLGPFIIMTWVDSIRMKELMMTRNVDEDDVLNPDIDEDTLSILYGELSKVLLQLSTLDFNRIGSLSWDEASGSFSPNRRPLTLGMNELVRYGGLTEDCLPSGVYSSSLDYLSALSTLHFTHLEKQANSIFSARDCRKKYTSRYLFQSLVPLFTSKEDNNGPFKFFCDDFGPGNVLVDEETLRITAVIDWEFCYAAPAQFLASAPEWLLLKQPDHWIEDHGLEHFLQNYLPKLDLFLRVLRKHETETAPATPSAEKAVHWLSDKMRRSMEDRTVWFNAACRNAWSVDFLYWNLLDNYVYGPASADERVARTTGNGELHAGREEFVRSKIEQLQRYQVQIGCDEKTSYEHVAFDERPEYWLKVKTRHDQEPTSPSPPLFSGYLLLRAVVPLTVFGICLFTLRRR